jgi:hypothetical protein
MKFAIKFLLAVGLVAVAAPVMAGQPVFLGRTDSQYSVRHSTISISSMTATVVNAVSGWREIKLQLFPTGIQDGTSVFYRLDGSTTNIAFSGGMLRLSTAANQNGPAANSTPGLNEWVFESSTRFLLQLSSGIIPGGPILGRVTERRLTP